MRTDLACRHLWLRGNEIQLSQMLLNLILNAYHAMEPGGGTLTVATRPEGEFLCFQVSDTGSGISPEVLPTSLSPSLPPRSVARAPAWDWPSSGR
ncbi:ATP-binding protein [Flavonifractor plautii]|nr:ATP-binding protein [Flavonifractor plautii]